MVYIHNALRSPVGAFQGLLKEKTAVELGAAVVSAVTIKAPPVDQVIMGNVIQANNGQAPARQVALLASNVSPTAVCTTVNKVCSSGMKAVIMGVQSLILKEAKWVVAGGMESMSTAPFYLPSGRLRTGLYGHGDKMLDSILRDGLLDPVSGKHMGEIAEMTAKDLDIGRVEQDEYAKLSYKLAKQSWEEGLYDQEIVKIETKKGIVSQDEEYSKVNHDKIGQLKPAFIKDGTITAANSSKLNDGASAVLLSESKEGAIAEIVGYGEAELAPELFTIAPSTAIPKALSRAFPQDKDNLQLSLQRISRLEVNEAFSVVAIANKKLLKLDSHPNLVYNGRGGAVSLGHPIGSSGCRIIVSLVHALEPGQYGVAAICNGGGGASAVVVKRL